MLARIILILLCFSQATRVLKNIRRLQGLPNRRAVRMYIWSSCIISDVPKTT